MDCYGGVGNDGSGGVSGVGGGGALPQWAPCRLKTKAPHSSAGHKRLLIHNTCQRLSPSSPPPPPSIPTFPNSEINS